MRFNNLHDIYEYCKNNNMGSIGDDQFDLIEQTLKDVRKINSSAEAREFLTILGMLRQKEVRYFSKLGMNAMETIVGAFAGGDEGVYSANNDIMNARFIFELVQNVDDCKFENAEDCHLTIVFDVEEEKVVLEYNELGFQPENVIAITGLGDSTKNHKKAQNWKSEEQIDQSDLQEIGEKGIGFKSIFGLAKAVSIKSNFFSFIVTRENFFVPVISGDETGDYFAGTRLELFLDYGMVGQLYHFLSDKYKHVEAIINENPILFLNKLTEIKYYKSEDDYFGFKVSRNTTDDEFSIQDTVIEYYSSEPGEEKCIDAIRYEKRIEYSVEECRSRYGNQEGSSRKHKIVVIAPKDPGTISMGRIYSFFATEEVVHAPFIIHAPFKLNSGRTRINSQSQGMYNTNKWFNRTLSEVCEMIHIVYEDLAKRNPENITAYIPYNGLVDSGCAISSELLKLNTILTWNIFQGIDGNFYPASGVCLIDHKGPIEDLIEIHSLLDLTKVLLNIPHEEIEQYKRFMISTTKYVQKELLYAAFLHEEKAKRCLRFLQDYSPDFALDYLRDKASILSIEQILVFGKCKNISKWINESVVKRLPTEGYYYSYTFLQGRLLGLKCVDISILKRYCEEYKDFVNPAFASYVAKSRFIRCDIEYPIYTSNAIFGNNMMDDYAAMYHMLEPKDRYFYPFLKMEAISEDIDILCDANDNIDDYQFLKRLTSFRLSQKNSLGNQYNSILTLIAKSGTNATRFFPEILQNIDDCVYESGTSAHAVISIYADRLVAEYNEKGFTRHNVRAITAIGDSTKKQLLDSNATGEKGIGFKAVFSVCTKVTIESGYFKFDLLESEPTIPKNITKVNNPTKGTKMVFVLKASINSIVRSVLADNKEIVKNCLCLKQLHSLQISGRKILISDSDKKRVVTIEQTAYEFLLYKYNFSVIDKYVLEERKESKEVQTEQKISYLIPIGLYTFNAVYNTFATTEKMLIPLIINMSMELDTARERILDNNWNKMMLRKLGDGLIESYDRFKSHLNGRLPLYFPDKTGRIIDVPFSVDNTIIYRIPKCSIFKVFEKEKYIPLEEGSFGSAIEYYLVEKHENLLGKIGLEHRANLLEMDKKAYDYLKDNYNFAVNDTADSVTCSIINEVFSKGNDVVSKLIAAKDFRTLLYDFLQTVKWNHSLWEKVEQWPIIPVKYQNSTRYVPYSEKIFAPPKEKNNAISSTQYAILDTATMSEEVFNKIYSHANGSYNPIKPFSKEIILAEFYRKLLAFLGSNDEKRRSEIVLDLFNQEKELFRETIKKYSDVPIDKMIFKTRTGGLLSKQKCCVLKGNESQGVFDQIIVANEFWELAKAVNTTEFSVLNNIDNLPFTVGLSVLRAIKTNRVLKKKVELYNSIYTSNRIGEDLKDGEGFFELYCLAGNEVKKIEGQQSRTIHVNEKLLSKFSGTINEISMSKVPISFIYDSGFSVFYKENILNEIEDELQLRKDTPKISEVRGLLKNCRYAKLGKTRVIAFRTATTLYLLIDQSVTADYDIIEVLKKFFSQYYNIELIVNRSIHRYTRNGFENISRVESTSDQVNKAYNQAVYVNLDDVEEVKDFVCKPIVVDGVTYGGYAMTCPLCKTRIHTELTGFRIFKTKHKGVLIPLVSCMNCHDALRYSTEITIDIDKLHNGVLDMCCTVNGYDWQIYDSPIRLGHRALIKRMNYE